MAIKTIADIDVAGKRVFVRADLPVLIRRRRTPPDDLGQLIEAQHLWLTFEMARLLLAEQK